MSSCEERARVEGTAARPTELFVVGDSAGVDVGDISSPYLGTPAYTHTAVPVVSLPPPPSSDVVLTFSVDNADL